MYQYIRPLLLVLVTVMTGCTPIWTGNQMQADIEQLKSEQETLTKNLRDKEAELTEMIASARSDVSELNKVIKDATELLQRNSADFGAEMGQLRQEMQSIRGESEQVAFKMQRLDQDLQLFKEDVDLRFSDGGGSALPDDANGLFKAASDKLKAGDTRTARKGFEKFLKRFGKDRRIDQALFFLGETYFTEKRFPSAVFEYQKILKSHSKSEYVDDATFRIGEAFAQLKKCQEAKVFFETVVKDFKKSKHRNSAKSQLKKLGSCK